MPTKPKRREFQYILGPTPKGVHVALYGKTPAARAYLEQRFDHHIVTKEQALDLFFELESTEPAPIRF